MNEIFIAENVKKQFANHLAINDVSISVPKGIIFGLLGPNGAGKTTLIRIINQITAPDKGRLFFDGQPMERRHIEQIGYLPEERGLYKKMKVGEQALYFGRLKGISKKIAYEKLKYWFKKFEIENWWDKKVEELSKGMQQKVQFIVTILHEPKLLIFDEPFSGFDPINVNLLKNEILYLKEQGATIIFSTHNMSSVEELCDNIALINKSNKILDGNVHEIKQTYKSNIFEIEFSGKFKKMESAFSTNYKILDIKENHTTSLTLQLMPDVTTNQLIEQLLPLGNIISLNEKIPTMNDIFIKVVEGNKNANSN